MSSDAEMAHRVEQACIAMEQATDASTRSAADAFLQSFRSTARPYPLCLVLLQGSGVASAQFIALGTMKVAIQREGRVLGGAMLRQLKDQLLNCLVMRANSWTRFVLNQCVHVVSILFKWICLDEDECRLKVQQATKTTTDERPAYIDMANCVASLLQRSQQATSADSGASGSASSLLALELSKSLISEFTQGASTANAGVSVSMHVRCHASFESHVLRNLASLILTQSLPAALQSLADPAAAAAAPDTINVLHSLLAFVDALLTFQFSDPKHPDALAMRWALASSGSSGNDRVEESVLVKPSAKWAPLLIESQLVEMVSHAHTLLGGLTAAVAARGAQMEPRLAQALSRVPEAQHLARNCLINLASIHGPVLADPPAEAPGGFVANGAASRTAVRFMTRVLTATNALLERSLAGVRAAPGAQGDLVPLSESVGIELIGLASVVKRILWPGSFGVLQSLPEATPLHTLLGLQHSLSLLLLPHVVSDRLHANGGRVVRTDTTKTEAFDLCLDNWSTLSYELQKDLQTPAEQAAAQALMPAVRQYTGSIFERYVHLRMQSNSTHTRTADDEDEDDEDEDEGQFDEASYVDNHLADVAALGKLHTQAAMALVAGETRRVLAQWQQIVAQSQTPGAHTAADPAALYAIHESLYFLLRLMGHLIGGGELSWKEADASERYCSIPRHMLEVLRADPDGSGIASLRAAVEATLAAAAFTHQILAHKLPSESASGSVREQHSLKEFCSPLVLESLVWLLQQFVAAGYFLVDQGRYESAASETVLPPILLQLYGGGNKAGASSASYGSEAESLLTALVHTCVSLISHYNEESSLMDLTLELLELCARHVPMRLLFRQQLLAQTPSPLKQFLLGSFLALFTTDPYALAAAHNSHALIDFQASQPFYNLSADALVRVADIIVQCLTFRQEDDCNDLPGVTAANKHAVNEARAQRRQQSLASLQGLLTPLTRSFFALLHHPQFQTLKSSLVLKFLTNYVSFYTGVVRELHVDNFDFLWHWVTASDAMMQVPTEHPQIASVIAQIATQAQAQEVQQMRGHAAGAAAVTASQQNLLATLPELIRQYNSDEVLAHAASDGAALQLFAAVLLFYRRFTECFLPYLNQAQSYRLMQAVLALVNVFTSAMERRTAAAARRAQSVAASLSGLSSAEAQHRREALQADAALLETAEWDILHSLLQLLECIGGKDHVDLSNESVEFASDAVLNGLMLLLPRLSGNMLARPKIAALFFNLLSSLVATNPDKLASVLNEVQRNQMLQVISFVFESEAPGANDAPAAASGGGSARSVLAMSTSAQLHTRLLREACAAVQAISQYHLYFVSGKAEKERIEAAAAQAAAANRGLPTEAPPPPSPFAGACAGFLQSLLRVLLHAHLTTDLLDPLSDALLPTILAQAPFFLEHVRGLLESTRTRHRDAVARVRHQLGEEAAVALQQQFDAVQSGLESGFQRLVPSGVAQAGITGAVSRTYLSSKTMAVERSQRTLFRQQIREFVLTVRPLINTSQH